MGSARVSSICGEGGSLSKRFAGVIAGNHSQQNMARWLDRPDGHYCTVHDYEFPRGETCTACVIEPGLPPGSEKTETQDEKDLKIREAEFRQRAKKCWRIASDMFDGNVGSTADACKVSAEAAKWERLALEARDRYAPKQETDELIREVQKLRGKGGSN